MLHMSWHGRFPFVPFFGFLSVGWSAGRPSVLGKHGSLHLGNGKKNTIRNRTENPSNTPKTELGGGFMFFNFHPYLERWSNLTHIFQRGWNHQLVQFGKEIRPQHGLKLVLKWLTWVRVSSSWTSPAIFQFWKDVRHRCGQHLTCRRPKGQSIYFE